MTGANAKIKRILVRQNGEEKQVYPYNPYKPYQPNSNTVAWYPLNSTTTTSDMKGSGTIYDLSTQLGSGGYATFGEFNGADCAHINAGGFYNSTISRSITTNYFTVMAWYAAGTGVRNLCNIQPTSSEGWVIGVDTTNKNIFYQFNSSSSNASVSDMVGAEEWMHIAMTYNNGSVKLYYNGVLKSSFNSSYSGSYNTGFMIGYTNWTVPNQKRYGGDGYVSDVILEKTVNSDSTILEYVNNTKSKYGL